MTDRPKPRLVHSQTEAQRRAHWTYLAFMPNGDTPPWEQMPAPDDENKRAPAPDEES